MAVCTMVLEVDPKPIHLQNTYTMEGLASWIREMYFQTSALTAGGGMGGELKLPREGF